MVNSGNRPQSVRRWFALAALAALLGVPAVETSGAGGATPVPCAPSWSAVASPNPTTGTNRLSAVSALSHDAGVGRGLLGRRERERASARGDLGRQRVDGDQHRRAPRPGSPASPVSRRLPQRRGGRGLHGAGDGSVLPLVERWNGTAWSASNPAAGAGDHRLLAVTARSSDDVTAVGYTTDSGAETPLVLRWNGAAWTASHPDAGPGDHRLAGVTAISASDIVAVGRTVTALGKSPLVLRWNGAAWSAANPAAGSGDHELRAVDAVTAADVTAVGVSTTVTGPGAARAPLGRESWTATNPLPNGELNAVAAVAAGEAWAVGRTRARRTPRSRCTGKEARGAPPRAPNGSGASVLGGVAALGALDLWAVGGDATSTLVEHYGAVRAVGGDRSRPPTARRPGRRSTRA